MLIKIKKKEKPSLQFYLWKNFIFINGLICGKVFVEKFYRILVDQHAINTSPANS
jgi:hypothetical protein